MSPVTRCAASSGPRKFNILKLRSFWIAVAIIGAVAGPWQYYSAKALLGIEDRHPGGWMFFIGNSRTVISILGLALCPIVGIGIYERLVMPARKGTLDGQWASAGALICSVWSFHSLMPGTGPEVRYFIALIPQLLLFLTAGTSSIARWIVLPGMGIRTRAWVFAGLVIAVFFTTAFSIPRKSHYGFDDVAELVQKPEHKSSVVLVSSAMPGGEGEGMLISEMAMRERRPSTVILRATKMLSQSDWLGAHYVLLYRTPDEVMKFLKSVPVGVVVIHNQRGLSGSPDHLLLQRAIATHSTEWERLASYGAGETRVDVYRMKSIPNVGQIKVRVNLPYTLGRSIEQSTP